MGWRARPFDDVRRELAATEDGSDRGHVRVDPGRLLRTGVPEFVLAATKSVEQVERGLRDLASKQGRAVATRCTDAQLAALPLCLERDFHVTVHDLARAVAVSLPGREPVPTGGRIGILTAGTSDAAAAAEAGLIARELGCAVLEASDVGVAGLHRLIQPLEAMAAADVDVIIVAAGMDGALPSVVAGLVPVPVIGLPTSVGYGYGGGGVGALTTMLQSCAPGLVVVNIDNGVGAAAAAAKIAARAGATRSASLAR